MTVTDDTLDELARDLGYRLDIIIARRELKDGSLTLESLHNRLNTIAISYGTTRSEVLQQISRPK